MSSGQAEQMKANLNQELHIFRKWTGRQEGVRVCFGSSKQVWATCQGGALTSTSRSSKAQVAGMSGQQASVPSSCSMGGRIQSAFGAGVNWMWLGNPTGEPRPGRTRPDSTVPGSCQQVPRAPRSSLLPGFPYLSHSLGTAWLALSPTPPSSFARSLRGV